MVFNVLSVTRVTFLPAFANHVKFVAGLAFVELGNAINLIKTFPGQLAGLLVHLDVGNSLSINCTPHPIRSSRTPCPPSPCFHRNSQLARSYHTYTLPGPAEYFLRESPSALSHPHKTLCSFAYSSLLSVPARLWDAGRKPGLRLSCSRRE